jgi:hypothetical protein
MGDRVYVYPLENVTIGTAVCDIATMIPGAANGVVLHHIHLEANVSAQGPGFRMRLKRGTAGATVTTGSAGAAATVRPVDPVDAAVVGTYRIGDTTQATSSGSFDTLAGFFWDVALPFDHMPAPEDRERCVALGGLILDLPAVVVSTIISGYVKFALVP